ncbi:MAG: hypothetical protein IJY80_01560, partial [Opitutales bacterium]|nr:hypothetical protein [Opitutales bacterium]
MALSRDKLGQLIQLEDERNEDGDFTLEDVKGISIQKLFIKTKADIINTMEPDGVVFLTKDNEHCKKLYNKENREK